MEWVVIVDDDSESRSLAKRILEKDGIRVTALSSGEDFLNYIEGMTLLPDLVLMDVVMPGMDGIRTTELLYEGIGKGGVPVIFLTGEDEREKELKALKLGASDFIRKPFYPEILIMRARHIIELTKLQRSLTKEVEEKTRENDLLTFHVVQTLAEAIDAKDTYTNGHSGRVASYSRELAGRLGYDEDEQNKVFMMGLLHDVGKIGVPDWIINKPGRLTDEEFQEIKKHPVVGNKILERIREMPELSFGARWHHERYDGRGYPDGLKGEEIPEIVRIIAVADAYDAMTSNRSYRDELPQEVVRGEIVKGKGTQFDPRIADAMIQMIDEDKDYVMKESAAEEAGIRERSEEKTQRGIEKNEEIPDGILKITQLDTDLGTDLCGDTEDYIEALKIFAESVDSKSEKIEQAFVSGDITTYTTLVHSLKSSAHTVGALELSDMAKKMETAGKTGDMDSIKDNTDKLLSRYRELGKLIRASF